MHAIIEKQPITRTLEENYMPYAMSVIVSRAIPEIDGFKPAHRKLLYTMFKMGLLSGPKTKSANIVGQTMKLNPHGDMAIYETMVRLTRGYEALLHPYVDSKGSFGKHYSRDMAFAASRYTEAKLDPICAELFLDIEKDTVDFQDNYDGLLKEPVLLPCAFPNILVSPNTGIAVGMASSFCSFNLNEVVETTIGLIKNPEHNLMSTLLAPDFAGGGELIFSPDEMQSIYETGRGSFKLRAKWKYDKSQNMIEVFEIPYTTTAEAIIDKIATLIKAGKLQGISDVRDETDLKGLKIAIELKRGTDHEKLMQRLFMSTPLLDSFSCNFNLLIAGTPQVLGVREILNEWIAFRIECIKRSVHFDLLRKKERLHLLTALNKILLDIDKAIKIVKDTDDDSEVVPNLMIGFGIDERQAEYIAEIKLRNLNKQYILKILSDTDNLKKEIADLSEILESRKRQEGLIIAQLKEISKKYGMPRKTQLVYEAHAPFVEEHHLIEDYPVTLFLTSEGYFKKIKPESLRMSGEQKLKEGDELKMQFDASNKDELIVFTSKCQAYKTKLYEFDDHKASVLGDFLPSKLGFEPGEAPLYMLVPGDYSGSVIFFYEPGRAAKVPLSAYETKTNRKRLTGAFCDKFPLVAMFMLGGETDFVLISSQDKYLTLSSALVPLKESRSTQGVIVMTLRGKNKLNAVLLAEEMDSSSSYRPRSLPSAGFALKKLSDDEQLKLD